MRGFKLAAIAVGVLIAFLLVGTVVGAIVHAVVELLIVAAIAGAIVVAIKIARSGKQVSGRSKDSEIRDHHASSALPRSDLDQYVPSTPTPTPAPRPASRPAAADVDDELARLKREMGS
jgi:hypothetical protein